MPDCIKCTMDLLEAAPEKLTSRIYNITGMSFTPAQQAESIRKVMPEFQISYKPDFRQAIADSWPKSIDDSLARKDWGWKHQYVMFKTCFVYFTYFFTFASLLVKLYLITYVCHNFFEDRYDLDAMTRHMFKRLKEQQEEAKRKL
jgi:hypothetical protein